MKINEAINNPNNNKMIIPYRRTATGKRPVLQRVSNVESDSGLYKKPENTKTFQ